MNQHLFMYKTLTY